jgi:hypothetical protein
MTYTTVTATAASGGWSVRVSVVTSGNPGTTYFGVRDGGTAAVSADQLSSEIEAGCP